MAKRVRLHELKTHSESFLAVSKWVKTAELRKLDRDYRVGDYLLLKEYTSGEYTGDTLLVRITHILDTREYGLQSGYGMLSFTIPSGVNWLMVRHKSTGDIGRVALEEFKLTQDHSVVNVTWTADATATPKPTSMSLLKAEKFFAHGELLHRADIVKP